MRPHKLLSGPFLPASRSRDDACLMEDVGDRSSTDIDLKANIHRIANLRVTPAEITIGDLAESLAQLRFLFSSDALTPP